MRKSEWSRGDVITYGTLFVGALMLAIDTAFRTYPNLQSLRPAWTLGPIWGFAPLLLILTAGILAVWTHWPPRTAGLALDASLKAPDTRKPEETERANAALQVERNRTLLAEERAQTLEAEATKRDAERTAEVAELKNAIADGARRVSALSWETNYHVAFPALRPLNQGQLDAMMPLLDQCRAAAKTASEEAEKVLMDLLKRLEFVPPPSEGSYLAQYIGIHVLRPMKRAADLLTEQRADARAALVTFAIRYHIARRWIQNCLGVVAHVSTLDPTDVDKRLRAVVATVLNYREWLSGDSEWFTKLDGVLVIQSLSDVRGEIQQYLEINGLTRDLPRAMAPTSALP